jgi:hypothetical protein
LKEGSNLKKWTIFILTLSFLAGVILFDKIYEPFPVKNVSKAEVLENVKEANGKIVRIPSNYQNYQWYISQFEKADENILHLLKEKGWSFIKKENDYYYFEGPQGNIVVHSKRWKKYSIVYFPEGI